MSTAPHEESRAGVPEVDETHDPSLRSRVASANVEGGEFPLQNLPFGVFVPAGDETQGATAAPRPGVAIGECILDLRACAEAGLLSDLGGEMVEACRQASLNRLMAQGRPAWRALRRRLVEVLREGSVVPLPDTALVPMAGARMLLPAQIGDYTDFYASVHHATNVGSLFRPDQPLLPNYKYVPVGYHGRASSVVVSGTPVPRPHGQSVRDEGSPPLFGPSRTLDYELEVGFFVGPGNDLGSPVPVGRAADQVFGLCLVNDWSARDIQKWEYQPLGPFLAKSFATSVSPWVVSAEALAPFRVGASARPAGDPAPLPHLWCDEDQARGGIDLELEVLILTPQMRAAGQAPHRLSRGNFRDMYWTLAQMLAHHTSNGCNLRPGDLLASGTVSGPEPEARGSLIELTWRGKEPVDLPGGEVRRFLEDGDEVIMRGHCRREGFASIGFGECRGMVGPALA